MLLILRKQPEAAAMTRWGVRVARAGFTFGLIIRR